MTCSAPNHAFLGQMTPGTACLCGKRVVGPDGRAKPVNADDRIADALEDIADSLRQISQLMFAKL